MIDLWCRIIGQAIDFCDSSNHKRALPTKQNVLCEEQSIWQVMELHSDFQRPRRSRRTSRSPADPSVDVTDFTVTTSESPAPSSPAPSSPASLASPADQDVNQTPAVDEEAKAEAEAEGDGQGGEEEDAAPAPFSPPNFEYVFPSRPRYVLVLDRSSSMADMVRHSIVFFSCPFSNL